RGLVIASDLGIAANCTAVGVLLHYRKLVPLNGLEWGEILKAFLVSVAAGFCGWELTKLINPSGSRWTDLKALILISIAWAVVVAFGLWITKSKLPRDFKRRKLVGAKPASTI